MNILHVNTSDAVGGAAALSRRLHQGLRARGHTSWLAVRTRATRDSNVFVINNDQYRNRWTRACTQAARLLDPICGKLPGSSRLHGLIQMGLANPQRYLDIQNGKEDFDFPATAHLLELPASTPDLFHLHNLHGDYFDLRVLPALSHRLPVFITLHDAWLLSGHCAHALDCERWRIGCGLCPDLARYPPVFKDATAFNWKRKAQIYSASRVYVAAPSQWLMERVKSSMMAPAIRNARVIPNGIDLSIFRPGDKNSVRSQLGIPQDCRMVLYVAACGPTDPYKDFVTWRLAVDLVARILGEANLVFVILGEEAPTERVGSAEVRYVRFQMSEKAVAAYYQAADVYVHAAKADTFPLTIIEAMACGTPVVATKVGGIPEQVVNAQTGFLVSPADPNAMAQALLTLLRNEQLSRDFGACAADVAKARFSLSRVVDEYINWYASILGNSGMTDAY